MVRFSLSQTTSFIETDGTYILLKIQKMVLYFSLVLLIAAVIPTDAFILVSRKDIHTIRRATEDPSGLFRSGPYVPSGLTAEEYRQLKEKEAEKLRKMDFGAWGPRFKRSNRPDGDWLLQPKLWRMGFAVDDSSGPSITKVNQFTEGIKRFQTVCRRNLLPFTLLTVCLHALCSTIRVSLSAPTFRASALILCTWRPLQSTCILGVSIIFSPFVRRWLEWYSRHRLWTTRRMAVVSGSLSLLAFTIWSAVVVCMRVLSFR
jgi:hypothetical protein